MTLFRKRSRRIEKKLDSLAADHASLMQVSIRTLEVLGELQHLASRLAIDNQTAGAGQSALLLNRLKELSRDWSEILYQRDATMLDALTAIRHSEETLDIRLGSRFDELTHLLDVLSRETDESREQIGAVKLDAIVAVRELLEAMEKRWESSLNGVRDVLSVNGPLASDYPAPDAGSRVWNPEPALMNHLYGLLPVATAVDVGAHRGDIARCLVDTGYQVYAFEPAPRTFEELRERLGGRDDCHLYECAIGAADGTMPLLIAECVRPNHDFEDPTLFNSLLAHAMPPDLQFGHSINVPVRSLKSLASEGKIPGDIGLLKVDTEGFDLQVLRGLQDLQPHVIVAEFWAQDFLFGREGAFNRLDELVKEMRDRGYRWHIVMYRISGSEQVSFYCNYANALSDSWGNVFFFRDPQLFADSAEWCAAVLPRTELVLDDPVHPSAIVHREAPHPKPALEVGELKEILGTMGREAKEGIAHAAGFERSHRPDLGHDLITEKMRDLETRLAGSEREVRLIREKSAGLEELLAARNDEFAARGHEVSSIIERAVDLEKRLAARESEISAMSAKAVDLEKRLATRESEIGAITAKAMDLEKRFVTAERERTSSALCFKDATAQIESKLNHARVEEEKARAEAQWQSERARELAGAVQNLKRRIRRIRRSWSWKITAPFREVRRALVRIGRLFASPWKSN